MINKNRDFCQHNSGDLVYTISPLISQLHIASRKVMTKYVGPVVIYKSIDPHNYLLMTLDGKIIRRLIKHESFKTSKHKNKSRKCPKPCTFKTDYKCGTQNSEDEIILIKIPRINLKCAFIHKEKISIWA